MILAISAQRRGAESINTDLNANPEKVTDSMASISNEIVPLKIDPWNERKADALYKSIPLMADLSGATFIFGRSGSTNISGYKDISITFTTDSTASVHFVYRWARHGDTNSMVEDVEDGAYSVIKTPHDNVRTDNEYYPCFDSVLVLRNDQYGRDNGMRLLGKRFLIARTRHRESNTGVQLRIYSWLDPVNYPSRNKEFFFLGSSELVEIIK